ncbi:MAG: mechanosensitive ion channel [Gemmatimonadota bacterium]
MVLQGSSAVEAALQDAWSYLPSLLAALAILVLGWLASMVLATLVRGAIRRTAAGDRAVQWIRGEEPAPPMDVAGVAGRLAFWIGMLFVLVGFFQVLNLTLVTEPLNALLAQFAEFLPRLIGAAILLVIAWVVAATLRRLVAVVLKRIRFDDRIGLEPKDPGAGAPVSKAIAESVYWLVLLLFLPAILGALAVEGLLGSVQEVTDQLLGFLPNLLGATLILGVGWVVARLIRDIVTNLFAAIGVDSLGDRIGISADGGTGGLSKLAGLVLYVLILIPVVVASLNALALTSVTGPASSMLERILSAIPAIFAAALLLGLAFLVGRLVADLTASVLKGAGFDGLLERLGLSQATLRDRSPSDMVGTLVLVTVMLFAAIEAASVLGFGTVALMFQEVAYFGGQLILAVMVLGLGFYFAGLAEQTIRSGASPVAGPLGLVARIAILVLAASMALQQLNVGQEIITIAFAATVGSVAVAAAIAFGIGGREFAQGVIQKVTQNRSGK